MKKTKRNILMLASCITLSMGIMHGLSNSNVNQQVSIGAGYMAGETGGAGWVATSAITGGAAATVAYGALTQTWNPAGWVGWGVAGALAL